MVLSILSRQFFPSADLLCERRVLHVLGGQSAQDSTRDILPGVAGTGVLCWTPYALKPAVQGVLAGRQAGG